MKKVCFKTFGCKTNQYETQAMREKFLRAGFEETANGREADLFVINTCTVTGEGDRKNRQLIRRLHRENPNAQIAVTGCYVTLNRDEIAGLPGVSFVVPNQEKDRIVERVTLDTAGKFCGVGDESDENRYTDLSISYFADRSRAFIKVQDGCDHACTYCKVVIVRGPSRSRPLPHILDESRRLVDQGYKEIVLTGIQLGAYGDEWNTGQNLLSILRELNEIKGLDRIRMSSVDPSDVTPDLISFMSDNRKICPHLHLPLQSGDDVILKKMKRAYRREQYLDIVRRLRVAMPHFALTTDVMVAFPGEEEKHFQSTVEVLREALPLKVHIFPFSPREGTAAAGFNGKVSEMESRERIRRLHTVAGELSNQFVSQFTGQITEVLLESKNEAGYWEGHTGNYLKVRIPGLALNSGDLLRVTLEKPVEGGFYGNVASN